MALFIDRLGTFDVEIVDDTMFVYGSRFDLLDPRTYDWLQELVDTVVARTVRRTERYRDDFALLEADPPPASRFRRRDQPPATAQPTRGRCSPSAATDRPGPATQHRRREAVAGSAVGAGASTPSSGCC